MISKILLDTHILIWDIENLNKISKKAFKSIQENQGLNNFYISSITFLEVAILLSKKKLVIPVSLEKFFDVLLKRRKLNVLPIDANTAGQYVKIDDSINKDPADRMIVATAMFYEAILITADRNLLESKLITTIW